MTKQAIMVTRFGKKKETENKKVVHDSVQTRSETVQA